MDKLRYILALYAVIAYPPAVIFWLIVHPFAGFWRRLGPKLTYAILIPVLLALAAGIYQLRDPLLAVEFGTAPALWPLVVICYGFAIYVEIRCRKHLSFRVLAGVPELDAGGANSGRDRLITEGIYRQVRHPRYIGVLLGTLALALFTNYLAVYLLLLLTIPALYLVVALEERELRARFGEQHQRYCEQVPRFVPRRRRRPA